jgi:hypothetical protein
LAKYFADGENQEGVFSDAVRAPNEKKSAGDG